MKGKLIFGIMTLCAGMLFSYNATAQTLIDDSVITAEPGFFMAVVGGILLALGFQLVLTNLSMAAGISAAGNIKRKFYKTTAQKQEEAEEAEKAPPSSIPAGVKFMSAAGIWGMLTSAISLFFACMLSVRLGLIPDNAVAVALGLIIWTGFFITMFYLESKVIGSFLNGLFSTAVAAIRKGFSGIGGVFAPSDSSIVRKIEDQAIAKFREELSEFVADSNLADKLEEYFATIKHKELDTERLKNELTSYLENIRIEERIGEEPGEREIFLKVAQENPKISRFDLKKLEKVYDYAKSALKLSGIAGGIGGAAKLFSMSPPAQELKHEIEEYLLRTGEPELHPDILKAELEEIFDNPLSAVEIIRNKARSFDKETVVSVVAAKQGYNRKEALEVADKVEAAIDAVRDRVLSNKEIVENKVRQVKENIVTGVTNSKNQMSDKLEGYFRSFFERVDMPELNYDRLKLDFRLLMKNPKLAPTVLKGKLAEFDRDTLLAVLSANDRISRESAENIIRKFEEARNSVYSTIDKAEAELKLKAAQAKEVAIYQAENIRKTSMAASWWMFATFVISGLAAILGGLAAF